MSTVAIALGSNVDAARNLAAAATMLRARWPDIRFSRVYASAPVGYADQADFLNAAAAFETDEDARTIKARLEEIERTLGKATPFPSGPRTIDLDLLLYGDSIIEESGLTVPHPRMHLRRFVLEPLRDLLPTGCHPASGISWEALTADLHEQRIEPLDLRLSDA